MAASRLGLGAAKLLAQIALQRALNAYRDAAKPLGLNERRDNQPGRASNWWPSCDTWGGSVYVIVVPTSRASRAAERAVLAIGMAALAALAISAPGVAPARATPIHQVAPWVRWMVGPDAPPPASRPSEVVGAVEQPVAGSTASTLSSIAVRGWVVDRYSAARPDRVEVYDGPLPGGRLVLAAQPYVWRQDVADLFGSSAYKASGFAGTISPGSLAAGKHTLTFAAHFEWIGWWTTAVPLVVAPPKVAPPTLASDATTSDPAPNTAAPAPNTETVRVTCGVPASDGNALGVEVRVASARPFPVRGQLVLLRIGPVQSLLSRYPDDGDLHTLIFWLEPDEFAHLQPGDSIVVQYGFDDAPPAQDVWPFGPYDPSTAVDGGC